MTYVVWCKGNSFQDCAIKSFLLGLCCTKSAQQPFTGHYLLPSEKYIFTKVHAIVQGLHGCYLGTDMGCYLRVDSHSYGKISPRSLKERPHNLTKWTFWAHLHDTSPSFDERLEEKILEQPMSVCLLIFGRRSVRIGAMNRCPTN